MATEHTFCGTCEAGRVPNSTRRQIDKVIHFVAPDEDVTICRVDADPEDEVEEFVPAPVVPAFNSPVYRRSSVTLN